MTGHPDRPADVPAHQEMTIDHQALLEQFGGDGEILVQVIEAFLVQCPEQLAAVAHSVSAGDATELAKSAHKLKGSVSVFGAQLAVAAAACLERLGASGNLERAGETYGHLKGEVERLGQQLKQVLADIAG
ncbi:MAG: Hpt domain-containing protein [Gemmatimonadetes bacterium]|nr:Hpt domain-containing protein [Gemmatimonadota bacterium]